VGLGGEEGALIGERAKGKAAAGSSTAALRENGSAETPSPPTCLSVWHAQQQRNETFYVHSSFFRELGLLQHHPAAAL